ncbi:MAG TPA: isochorismatase family cysteine hydrolase [bacterium]|nr:isochorismatase family cysteine hydrolase [bacterium]
MELIIPGRYYRMYPPESYLGHAEETLHLALERTAFMLIDVYGLGYSPGEPEPERPALFYQGSTEVERRVMVDHIKPALEAARRIKLPVIYVNNSNQRVATQRSEFGSLLVRTHGLSVEERWETDPVEFRFSKLVEPLPGEYLVHKQMYSGFFETCLETLLRNLQIKNLVVVGFAANACVLGTLVDAFYRNYRILLLRDGTAAMEYHDTLEEQLITRYIIRHVEAFLGYTATCAEFVRSCESAA